MKLNKSDAGFTASASAALWRRQSSLLQQLQMPCLAPIILPMSYTDKEISQQAFQFGSVTLNVQCRRLPDEGGECL